MSTRTLMQCAAVALLVMVVEALAAGIPQHRDDALLFDSFVKAYNRQYVGDEQVRRFECFKANLDRIEQLNAREKVAKFGVNKFADSCPEEHRRLVGGLRHTTRDTREGIPTAKIVAKNDTCRSIDWRTKGAVTPVLDQGQCGACWAFSTTANIEGILAVAGFPLIQLSNEELLACVTSNDGCNGGLWPATYQWILDHGIDSNTDWPYTSSTGNVGPCNSTLVKHKVATIGGFINIPADEASMAAYVCKHGPINVQVDAETWDFYQGGVLTTCNNDQPDHTVAAVGFDLDATPPYWILKNEWGTAWGEEGYIRIEYGRDMCLVSTGPMTATPPKK